MGATQTSRTSRVKRVLQNMFSAIDSADWYLHLLGELELNADDTAAVECERLAKRLTRAVVAATKTVSGISDGGLGKSSLHSVNATNPCLHPARCFGFALSSCHGGLARLHLNTVHTVMSLTNGTRLTAPP